MTLIKKAQTAQRGHTSGENHLYRVLWDAGRPEECGSRIITIGWDRLAELAAVSPNTARNNCRNLVEKLALEVVAGPVPQMGVGHTYRIFPPARIVERRQQAGLTHVVTRRGGSVHLSKPVMLVETGE